MSFEHYSERRKIDPSRGDFLADGSPNDNDRIEIGPTPLAFSEWANADLTLPNLPAMREYRWQRLTRHIVDRDYGGLLMFDPLNIRYSTDSTNMQLWNTHNPFRAVLLCADGYMVIWDYKNSPFLSTFNPLVREQRLQLVRACRPRHEPCALASVPWLLPLLQRWKHP